MRGDDDQDYFWTPEWQAGERESAEARHRGDVVVFDGDDPVDVADWLTDGGEGE